MFYYLALCQPWNLLAGYAGLVSVGQQGVRRAGRHAFVILTAFLDLLPNLVLPLTGTVVVLIARSTLQKTLACASARYGTGSPIVLL